MSEANYETGKKIYTLAKGMHSAFAINFFKDPFAGAIQNFKFILDKQSPLFWPELST
jgi:hypothetical protein